MALDAGTSSPSLAVSQGEPSASALEMYACTSRTYAMHSRISTAIKSFSGVAGDTPMVLQQWARIALRHDGTMLTSSFKACIRTDREAGDAVAGRHVNAHDVSCLGCQQEPAARCVNSRDLSSTQRCNLPD